MTWVTEWDLSAVRYTSRANTQVVSNKANYETLWASAEIIRIKITEQHFQFLL